MSHIQFQICLNWKSTVVTTEEQTNMHSLRVLDLVCRVSDKTFVPAVFVVRGRILLCGIILWLVSPSTSTLMRRFILCFHYCRTHPPLLKSCQSYIAIDVAAVHCSVEIHDKIHCWIEQRMRCVSESFTYVDVLSLGLDIKSPFVLMKIAEILCSCLRC